MPEGPGVSVSAAEAASSSDAVDAALVLAFREEWGRVVATLIRVTGDWTLAEECAQEAFTTAAERWPREGVPSSPGAWLTTTARNRAIDRLRRASTEARKLAEVAAMEVGDPEPDRQDVEAATSGIIDDRLRLIFTCCHPALPLEARVALTLRTLCGLTVVEIGRAFGVAEPAMTKRLVRARQKIRHAGIPYRVPPGHLLGERLPGVLAVLYLLFTEGYSATAGSDVVRESLSGEAVRLSRALAHLMPQQPEVLGLLALELLHDARRAGRVDERGDLVPLEEQDRSLWDTAQVDEALGILAQARRQAERPGPYVLQASIAACHATARRAADTPWDHVADLYAELAQVAPSAYVDLNHAIAVAMSRGPDAGLERVAAIETTGTLDAYHLLWATRADLERRAGRSQRAAEAYRKALDLVVNEAERRYLERRLAETS